MVTGNNLNKIRVNDLKLILYLDRNTFSYTIFNTQNNCFEHIQSHLINNNTEDQIRHTIESDINLDSQYTQTLCVIDSDASTFIPEALFDKTNVDNYLHFVSDLNENDETKYVKQQFADCYSIFTINKDLLACIESKFESIKLKSTASLIVDYALSFTQLHENQILTQVNKEHFHITLIQNGEFIFYNKFNFETTTDFIYYFMNCMQNLSVPANNRKISIISDLDQDDLLFEKLKKYTQIVFVKRPEKFLYNNAIIEKSTHKNHNLFSQLICE